MSQKREAAKARRAKRKKTAEQALDRKEFHKFATAALDYLDANHVIVEHDGEPASTVEQMKMLNFAIEIGAVLKLDGPNGNIVGFIAPPEAGVF